jgi:hypothetical protein
MPMNRNLISVILGIAIALSWIVLGFMTLGYVAFALTYSSLLSPEADTACFTLAGWFLFTLWLCFARTFQWGAALTFLFLGLGLACAVWFLADRIGSTFSYDICLALMDRIAMVVDELALGHAQVVTRHAACANSALSSGCLSPLAEPSRSRGQAAFLAVRLMRRPPRR